MWQMDRAVWSGNSLFITSTGLGGREVQLAEKCKEERMTKTRGRMIAVNERGRRIGEGHPRAKLTDQEIDWIRELAEPELDAEGRVLRRGLSYLEIAEKFEISKGQVSKIGSCKQRAQTAVRFKRTK